MISWYDIDYDIAYDIMNKSYHKTMISDRQTTSFIDYSIEAGILLGGNGAFTPW
jgi:hypothetical protein